MDESADNQVSSDPDNSGNAQADADIPSPQQVSAESIAAAADREEIADGTLTPTADQEAADRKESASIIAAEEAGEHQLSSQPQVQAAAVEIAPQADDHGSMSPDLNAPSLADIVAAENDASAPKKAHKSAKAKKIKSIKAKRASGGKAPKSIPSATNEGNYRVYIVQPGDTLGTIARVIYGTTKRWSDLAQINGLDANGPIYPGDSLKFAPDAQSADFEAKWEGLKKVTLTIQKNETLSRIAERTFGKRVYWKLLWRWNEAVIADPHSIAPGQTLTYVAKEDLTAFFAERNGASMAH